MSLWALLVSSPQSPCCSSSLTQKDRADPDPYLRESLSWFRFLSRARAARRCRKAPGAARGEFPRRGRGPSRAGASQTSGERPGLVPPRSVWPRIPSPTAADAWGRGGEQNERAVMLPPCFPPAARASAGLSVPLGGFLGLFSFLSLNFSSRAPGVSAAGSRAALPRAAFAPLRAGGEAASASPLLFPTPCGVFPSPSGPPSAEEASFARLFLT